MCLSINYFVIPYGLRNTVFILSAEIEDLVKSLQQLTHHIQPTELNPHNFLFHF